MRRLLPIGLAALVLLGVTLPHPPALATIDQRARVDTIGATKRFKGRALQTVEGAAIGSLNAIGTRDQKGDADDPASYLRARPDAGPFDVRLTFRAKDVAPAATLDLAASVRFSAGRWKLQVRDHEAGRWVTLLAKADVPAGAWAWKVAGLDADRMVGAGGRIRVRLIGDGGPLDIDYLVMRRTVWQPKPGTTWQLQLSGKIDTSYDVEMYDVDLIDTPQVIIDGLHADGRVVVCYFSAGSWENWRDDAGAFPEEVLGDPLEGWEGEQWLDIRRLDLLQPIMSARLDVAVSKGCDAVDPDNVDGYTNDSGFALSPSDQLAYNRWLAAAAHRRGLSVGLKNDLDQIPQLVDHFDWALNEQCFEYDECDRLTPFVDDSKAVFGVEYSGPISDFCPQADALGFSWLKKLIGLGPWVKAC